MLIDSFKLFCKHFQIFHISPVFWCPKWMQYRTEHSFWARLILPVGERRATYQTWFAREGCLVPTLFQHGYHKTSNSSPENSFLYTILFHLGHVCYPLQDFATPCPTCAVFYPVGCINWLTFYLNLHNTETSCFFCKWISGIMSHKQRVSIKNTYNLLKLRECSFCTCVLPAMSRHHPSSEGVKLLCLCRS